MDVHAGMAALQAGQAYLYRHVAFRDVGVFLELERDIHVRPAGAAHEELAFLLGVAIQQDVAFQEVGLQPERPVHGLLLVDREQRLDRSVPQALIGQHGHRQRHAHAIVGAQCRIAGRDPFAIYVSVDRIFLEIMSRGGVLLRNHVQVRLERHGLASLHAGGGRFAD